MHFIRFLLPSPTPAPLAVGAVQGRWENVLAAPSSTITREVLIVLPVASMEMVDHLIISIIRIDLAGMEANLISAIKRLKKNFEAIQHETNKIINGITIL